MLKQAACLTLSGDVERNRL